MSDNRIDELVRLAAEAFDDGRSVDGHFLVEHKVTADECFTLSAKVAAILRGYLAAPSGTQTIMLAAGVMPDHRMAELVWKQVANRNAMAEATAALRGFRQGRKVKHG